MHVSHAGGYKPKIQVPVGLGFSWGFSSYLADGCLLVVTTWPFLCAYVPLVSLPLLIKVQPLWPHLNLRLLSSNIVTLGERASTYEFGGDTIQSITIWEHTNCLLPVYLLLPQKTIIYSWFYSHIPYRPFLIVIKDVAICSQFTE